MDYNIKNALYASVGVREYRIVDPAKERTTIYYYEQDAAPMIIPFHQEVISGIYKNLKIKIADLLIKLQCQKVIHPPVLSQRWMNDLEALPI